LMPQSFGGGGLFASNGLDVHNGGTACNILQWRDLGTASVDLGSACSDVVLATPIGNPYFQFLSMGVST
jgi:hypothetical protein